MADKYIATAEDLTALANSIRVKAEVTGSLVFPTGFIGAISGIQTGLESETGSWTPSARTTRADIAFSNSHATPPNLFVICTSRANVTSGIFYYVAFVNTAFFGGRDDTHIVSRITGSTTATNNYITIHQSSSLDDFCTNEKITYYAGTNVYFAPAEYKWVAIWLPTT